LEIVQNILHATDGMLSASLHNFSSHHTLRPHLFCDSSSIPFLGMAMASAPEYRQ
jgi:hypothetical protein